MTRYPVLFIHVHIFRQLAVAKCRDASQAKAVLSHPMSCGVVSSCRMIHYIHVYIYYFYIYIYIYIYIYTSIYDAPSPPTPFVQPAFWYEHICVSCDVARSIGCECFMRVYCVIRVSNPIPPPSEQRHDIIPPPHPHAPHNDTTTFQASSSAACKSIDTIRCNK